MAVEIIMIGIMAYQVMMPAVNNGKYQMVYDGANIVRMNTQDGSMERCTKEFKCEPVEQKKEEKRE